MATAVQERNVVQQRILGGGVGGILGGIAFGILMGMMGMLPMIAGLIGSESALVGFLVHMVISALIGGAFGMLLGQRVHRFSQGAVVGLLYGAVWWVLGPMILMPLMMGMGTAGIGSQIGAAFTTPLLMSLVGHLIYGVVAGLGYVWYTRR